MKKLFLILSFSFLIISYVEAQNFYILKTLSNYGVVNSTGELIVPFEYDNIKDFGQNKFMLLSQESKFGVADSLGNIIIKCKYSKIEKTSNNFMIVYSENSEIALFNIENMTLSEFIYKDYNNLSTKYFILRDKDSIVWLCNKVTNKISKTVFDDITQTFSTENTEKESIFGYLNTGKDLHYKVLKDDRYGLYDDEFNQILPIIYDNIYLSDNFWYFSDDITNGFSDIYGNIKIQTGKFINFFQINGNLYQVKDKNFFIGVYDIEKQELIIDCKYNDITSFEDYFIFENSFESNISDLSGKILISSDKYSFKIVNDLIQINPKNKIIKGLMNFNEKILLEPEFGNISTLGSDFFYLSNKYEKFVDTSDNSTKYKLIKPNISGVCNKAGKVLFEGTYSNISYNSKANVFIVYANSKVYLDRNSYYYPCGIVNQYNDLLLDTICFYNKLFFDFNEIQYQTDSVLYSFSLDNSGKLIEKIKYRNYIKINIDTLNTYFWKYQELKYQEKIIEEGYNMFDMFGNLILANYFDYVDSTYCNSKYTLAQKETDGNYVYFSENKLNNEGKYIYYDRVKTIIDNSKGKVLQSNIYFLDTSEFSIINSARCFYTNRKCALINKNYQRISQLFTHISEFKNNYAVAFYDGEVVFNINDRLVVDFVQTHSNVFAQNQLFFINEKFHISGGKAGIINNLGDTIIPFNYTYLCIGLNDRIIAARTNEDSPFGLIDFHENVIIPFDYEELSFFYDFDITNLFSWKDCSYILAKKDKKYGIIDIDNNTIIDFIYDDINYLPNNYGDYFAVEDNDKWGLVDKNGNIIIPIIYSAIDYLKTDNKNYFVVSNDEKLYGYFNDDFNYQIIPQFDDAEDFKNGYARVKIGKYWNYVDNLGNVISDLQLKDCNNFYENRAAVKEKSKWGYIDTSGNYITEQIFDWAGNFNHGVAPVKYRDKKNKKNNFGIIDSTGNFVIKPSFYSINEFTNGYAIYKTKKKKYGIINTQGKIIVKAKYKSLQISEYYDFAFAQKFTGVYIIIELDNPKNKTKNSFKEIYDFTDGLALVKAFGKYGFIDSSGNFKIEPKYKQAKSFSCGLAAVREKKKWGYINSDDTLVIDYQYSKVESFSNNIAKVENKIIIDTNNNILFENQFLKYYNNENQTGFAYKGTNKYHLLNIDNISNNFKKIINLYDDYYILKNTDNEYYIIDFKGNEIVENVYKLISEPSENLILVSTNKMFGLYDSEGKILLPCFYSEIIDIDGKKVKCTAGATTNYLNLETNSFLYKTK